nr:hypothetical protein [Leptolyngbya sp. FACHB-36]
MWDVVNGQCLQILQGHSSLIFSVAFSADGKNLVSSSMDETIKIWDLQTYKCIGTLKDRPYEGMDITGVKGLPEAEKATLKALGAIEQ